MIYLHGTMSQAPNSPGTKRNTLPEAFFPMEGGMKVCAPDSLQLITPYVLREQGDWFELRRFAGGAK
jgi:hypothetical protein